MNPTSIDKALHILEFLAVAEEPAALQDIVESVQLPKSSVHRLLNCLQDLGYVSRPSEGRKYMIGPRAARLSARNPQAEIKAVARPLLRQLHDEFNETVNLGFLSGQQVLYLDFIETTHPLRYVVTPGDSNPWNCTAMGIAIAAGLDDAKLERLLTGVRFVAMTPHTIVSSKAMRTRLAQTRKTGIAEESQESAIGVCCLAINLASLGFPSAAISVAVPRERLTPETKRSLVKSLSSLI
jgi:IclR family acetate operon transcriptional repressor